MEKKRIQSSLLLLLTSLIWGTAFVFQSLGGDAMSAYAFNALRSFVACLALLPVMFFVNRRKKSRGEIPPEQKPGGKRTLIIGGVVCGIILVVAGALQQLGINETTVGKAGFITALYIVFVPICGIFFKRKVHFAVWISVVLGVVGLYFLCMKGGFSLQKGDALVLLCAFGYTAHILVIDHFSPIVDCIKMSCIQFFVCAVISGVIALFVKDGVPTWEAIGTALIPILYTGVISSGVGYTLQMISQRNLSPAVASLLMSLESVFAALAGWVLLHETFSLREIFGCVLMFCAILLAQAPDFIASRAAKKANKNSAV